MRRISVVLLLLLWGVFGVFVFYQKTQKDDSKLVEAFSQTDFEDTTSVVTAYGTYEGDYMTRAAARDFLKKLAVQIGLDENYSLTETRNENSGEVSLKKEGKVADTSIRFITYEEQAKQAVIDAQQYIVLTFTFHGSADSVMTYKKIASDLMDQYNFQMDYRISFTGTYKGNLSLDERNVTADTFLKKIDAKVVSEHRSDDLYTIYAYTNDIDSYKKVSGEKINVSLSMNYDETQGKTELYLVSPMINEDF